MKKKIAIQKQKLERKFAWVREEPWETWIADTKGPYVLWNGMQQVPFPAQKKWMSMMVFVTFASKVLIMALFDPPASFWMLKSCRTLLPCNQSWVIIKETIPFKLQEGSSYQHAWM